MIQLGVACSEMSDSDMIHPNLRHLANSPLGSGASVPPQPALPSPQHLRTVFHSQSSLNSVSPSLQSGLTVSFVPEPQQEGLDADDYLKIGLGVGLGVPFLILICCYMARFYRASRKRRATLPRYVSDVIPPTPPLRSEPEQPRSPTIRNRMTPSGSRRSLAEIAEEGMNSPSHFIDVSGGGLFETPKLSLPMNTSDPHDQ